MFRKIINRFLRFLKLELVEKEEINFFRNIENSSILFSELPEKSKKIISPFMPHSKSQLAQDLFVLAFSKNTKSKFFVEFGATDGLHLSNTWLLEKKLGWEGILAEPAKIWHKSLKKNRDCIIETKCVAAKSGLRYKFLEVNESEKGSPSISSVEKYSKNGDWASKIRLDNCKRYEVETISLNDLLDKHNAPKEIQFLSIDTEGGELDILKGYDFNKRKILIICVEHNYVEKNRKKIYSFLTKKGYKRVLMKVSKFDDWYILNNL